jgi:hypothetical protein
MIQPKENPGHIPDGDKENQGKNKADTRSVLKSQTEEHPAEDSQKNAEKKNYIRTKFSQIFVGTKKYFKTMFFNEKSAFWTMVFTGFLTVFTFFLFRVSDNTDKSIRVTQRAFVSYRGVASNPAGQDPITKKIVFYGFSVSWENTGTTPTRNATMHVSPYFAREPIPTGWGYPDLYPNSIEHIPAHVVIGPRGLIATTPTDVPTYQMQLLSNKTSHFYFYGWVLYNDVFEGSPKHITEFCTEIVTLINQDFSEASASHGVIQSDCAEHNCYDRECSDYAERIK